MYARDVVGISELRVNLPAPQAANANDRSSAGRIEVAAEHDRPSGRGLPLKLGAVDAARVKLRAVEPAGAPRT